MALTARMTADVNWARAEWQQLPVGVVQDAAAELWILVGTAPRQDTRLGRAAVDRCHLTERLADIFRVVEPEERRRTRTSIDGTRRSTPMTGRSIASPGGWRNV
jgi:hypothetical protein